MDFYNYFSNAERKTSSTYSKAEINNLKRLRSEASQEAAPQEGAEQKQGSTSIKSYYKEFKQAEEDYDGLLNDYRKLQAKHEVLKQNSEEVISGLKLENEEFKKEVASLRR